MFIVVLSMNRSFLQRVQHVGVCIELALHVFQSLIMSQCQFYHDFVTLDIHSSFFSTHGCVKSTAKTNTPCLLGSREKHTCSRNLLVEIQKTKIMSQFILTILHPYTHKIQYTEKCKPHHHGPNSKGLVGWSKTSSYI